MEIQRKKQKKVLYRRPGNEKEITFILTVKGTSFVASSTNKRCKNFVETIFVLE